MRQEVDSRDEVMHSEMSDWWFSEKPYIPVHVYGGLLHCYGSYTPTAWLCVSKTYRQT